MKVHLQTLKSLLYYKKTLYHRARSRVIFDLGILSAGHEATPIMAVQDGARLRESLAKVEGAVVEAHALLVGHSEYLRLFLSQALPLLPFLGDKNHPWS